VALEEARQFNLVVHGARCRTRDRSFIVHGDDLLSGYHVGIGGAGVTEFVEHLCCEARLWGRAGKYPSVRRKMPSMIYV
jgi:hypothetical protein